ncbi:MAG: hypothetical protein JOY66_23825 [Acetobacteraceae bacterium]|nr:hypothetical protein [Acetobacteraceae bacterium]
MRPIWTLLPAVSLLLSGGAALAASGAAGPQAGGPSAGAGSAMAAPYGKPRGGAAAAPAGGGKFATEGEAAKACGGANVVWGNASTKVFHVQGDQFYGHTKHGAFMCKSTAAAGGFHQAGQSARKG